MPVLCMSMRFLTGMVQALDTPGRRNAWSIWRVSSAGESRSDEMRRQTGLIQLGQPSYQAGTRLHSCIGLKRMTVSIIESGAGFFDVSARPAFPHHALT